MEENKKKPPACIGIIMDGNRRWARQHKLPIFSGHNAGYKKLKEIVLWAKEEEEVKNLVVYAFSTENWNRNKKEISTLTKLFEKALEQGSDFKKNDIKITFIGQRERFGEDFKKSIEKLESATSKCKSVHLIVALSYGGRVEIISAVNELLYKKSGSISEKEFSENLWTANIPDPDIIIRTGGEKRLSNFLSWQSVYSELFFVDTYWPAFTKKEFKNILTEYMKRKKRKGI